MNWIQSLGALALFVLAGCSSNRPAAPLPPAGVLGDLAYESADYATAASHYARHLIGRPGDVHRRTRRGIALARLGRHEESLAELDRAVEQGPDRRETWFARSHVRYQMGDFVGAEEDLGQVLASEGFPGAGPHEQLLGYALLAQIAIRTRDADGALAAIDRALDLARRHAGHITDGHRRKLLNNRAMVLFEMGAYERARDDYEEYLESRQNAGVELVEHHQYMGCYLNYLARDFDRSRNYFERLDDEQLRTLGDRTEDPDFFARANFTEVERR